MFTVGWIELAKHTSTTIANTVATTANTIAKRASTIATATRTAATWVATTASVAFTAATRASTAAVVAGSAAVKSAAVTYGAFAATLGAVTGALAALAWAWHEANELTNSTEGLGVTGTIREMIDQGTFDPFEAINNYQDRQARERAAARDQPSLATQADHTAHAVSEVSESRETVDIRVSTDQGSKATVTRSGKGSSLRIKQTGAPLGTQ